MYFYFFRNRRNFVVCFLLKVPITIFFYSLIRIYTSSNDVPRRNFLIPTKRDFFYDFLKSTIRISLLSVGPEPWRSRDVGSGTTVPDRRNLTENAALNAFLKRSNSRSFPVPFAFHSRSVRVPFPFRSRSLPVPFAFLLRSSFK